MTTTAVHNHSPASALAPGPRFRTPQGFLADLRVRPVEFLTELWHEYGDISCIRIAWLRSYLLVHPDHVRHVLVTSQKNYWKGAVLQKLTRVTGHGLLFSEGEVWKRQRRLVAPAFARQHVASLAPVMTAAASDLLQRWEQQYEKGAAFDVLPEMSKVALDVVCRAMFGTDILERADDFHHVVNEALDHANHLINTFYPLPMWVPTSRNRRMKRTMTAQDAVIYDMIRQHRERPGSEADLLSMMLEARDEETGREMTDQQIRDEMVTFLTAGHETTGVTLAWTFYLLGQHPEIRERLYEEVDRVLGSRPPGLEDLPQLTFTGRVIDEALRLYPPAWSTVRQALADDEVGGYRIPKNAMVTLSPWITHRHPAFWDEPERFDPDRFLPRRSEDRHRFAYIPFGAGGRRCIGEDFALQEARIVLAAVTQRYELRPVPGHPVEVHPIFTLRPRHGVRVTLHCRH
jgi:cytochrome P450